MVKPNITGTQSTTTPKPPVVEVSKVADAAKAGAAKTAETPKADSEPEAPAEPVTDTKAAPVAAKRDKGEKRHPCTVQLSPTVWRRAKLLASLQGATVSRMVEQDLVKRIASELKVLLEGLDKVDE